MHGRFRNPGNGVRSGSFGIEGSIRAPGLYNADYRNFNRGFGRGSTNKSFPPAQPPQPPQPPLPPRKTDIFMEAGRLAAEYLVSQGLLPPNVLSENSRNGSLNNQIRESQDLKNQDIPAESRTPVLGRLGSVNPETGLGGKTSQDEFTDAGSGRGRKQIGSFRSYSSDWSRENGNAAPQLEKTKSFSDVEGESDIGSAKNEEQQVGVDTSIKGLVEFNSTPPKGEDGGESESERENAEFASGMGSKTSSSSTKEEIHTETDGEISKGSDDSKVLNMENAELEDKMSDEEIGEQGKVAEDIAVQYTSMEGESTNKSGSDLLQLSGFAKVPTRIRSSLSCKASEVNPVPPTDDENKSDIAQQEDTKAPIEEYNFQETSNSLENQTQNSQLIEPEISKPQSIQTKEEEREVDAQFAVESDNRIVEQSLPGGSFIYDKDSRLSPSGVEGPNSQVKDIGENSMQNDVDMEGTENPREWSSSLVSDAHEFRSCSSPVKERGEKRAIENYTEREVTKKPREWSSSIVIDADEYFSNQNFDAMPSNAYQERFTHEEDMVKPTDQEKLVDVAFFPKSEAESGMDLKEENHHFQNSFKICDLNLMESSDMTENPDNDPVLDLPSTLEVKKEVPMDIDQSINNNCTRSNEYSRQTINGKEVIIVDLEDDSPSENAAFDTSNRRNESAYTGMGNFPNNTGNTSDLPDGQDGYGLMISELLGSDLPPCSSVPTGMNALQTDIGLHNEEGILCDDDPIYLSLGDIPALSLGFQFYDSRFLL